MPIYQYKCTKCEEVKEISTSMANMKKWTKCSGCGKRATRYMGGPIADFKVQGGTPTYHYNSSLVEKENRHKAHKWHDEEVRNTRKAIEGKTGASPYSQMKIDHKQLEKDGVVKKCSPEETKKRSETATALVKDAVSKLSGSEKDHAVRGSGNSGQK